MNLGLESQERILRVHTIARLLGCSRRETIRRRIQKKQIPARRIGKRAWGIEPGACRECRMAARCAMLEIEIMVSHGISCCRIRIDPTLLLFVLSFAGFAHWRP